MSERTRTLPIMEKPDVATCTCCDLSFTVPVHRDHGLRCPMCREHYCILNEQPERREARTAAHEKELRRRLDVMIRAQRQADATIRRLKDRDDRDALARAYDSRDRWRDALTFVIGQHVPTAGRCSCGVAWPCLTITSLEKVNPGIARAVEDDIAARERRDLALRQEHEDQGRTVMTRITARRRDDVGPQDWDQGTTAGEMGGGPHPRASHPDLLAGPPKPRPDQP